MVETREHNNKTYQPGSNHKVAATCSRFNIIHQQLDDIARPETPALGMQLTTVGIMKSKLSMRGSLFDFICTEFLQKIRTFTDTTRHDTTRHDTTRHDATRRDATRRDATRRDATRRDAMRCDAMRCDTIRYDTIQYNTIHKAIHKTLGLTANRFSQPECDV